MSTTANRRHYARARTGTVLHVVAGVHEWYSGMQSTAECGAKRVHVLESQPPTGFVTLPAGTCERCAKQLGCTVRKVPKP